MLNNKRHVLTALVALTLSGTVVALADDFDLDWWTVDGGGQMRSTGGGFELSGTVGQPDAGAMTGGGFELAGGFWAVAAATAPDVCPGDSNCDGYVSWRDIDYFVAAMTSQAAWQAMFAPGTPSCSFNDNDTNGDGFVSWRDIDPLVALMNTSCP